MSRSRLPVSRHLFAYGTLMTAAAGRLGAAQRRRLAREATSLGAATTMGRIYDLGRYPGLVLSDDAGEIVHGEVLELADPAATLAWLDAYEGLSSAEPGQDDDGSGEYTRTERTVCLADGRSLTAAVYVYLRELGSFRRLTDGRWPAGESASDTR